MDTDEKKEDYRRKYKESQKEIERLQKELERYKKENKDLKKKLALIEEEKALKAPSPFYRSNTKGKRKRAGAPKGHKGISRKIPRPEEITHEMVLTTDTCPQCGGRVEEPENGDVRYIYDIPPPIPIVMKVTTKRPYCPRCGIRITPRSKDHFPGKSWGNNLAITVSTWRMLGITRGKIKFMLNQIYGLDFSTKTIQDMEQFVAKELRPAYNAIKERVRNSDEVGADETSWRKDGKNHWLWVFSTVDAALFVVDRSRGRKVPETILNESFEGVVVEDGWNGYNSLEHRKQQCLVHINRQIQRGEQRYRIEPRGFLKDEKPVYKRRGRPRKEFVVFSAALRKIMREAVLSIETEPYEEARIRAERNFKRRLDRLIKKEYKDRRVLRMVKFLKKHRNEIFTFLGVPGVPWHNNRAERDIRPSVVIRKNSYGSRSTNGTRTFETMMTFFMTCKKRGLNFIEWLRERLGQRALGVFTAGT
jgi:transposase